MACWAPTTQHRPALDTGKHKAAVFIYSKTRKSWVISTWGKGELVGIVPDAVTTGRKPIAAENAKPSNR